MMAARYEHRTGGADNTYCTHCGTHTDNWGNQVCKLKPNLTAEEIEGEIDNAPLIHIHRGDEFPGVVLLAVRDEFAKAALTGLIAAGGTDSIMRGAMAKFAYEYADAMMEARDA